VKKEISKRAKVAPLPEVIAAAKSGSEKSAGKKEKAPKQTPTPAASKVPVKSASAGKRAPPAEKKAASGGKKPSPAEKPVGKVKKGDKLAAMKSASGKAAKKGASAGGAGGGKQPSRKAEAPVVHKQKRKVDPMIVKRPKNFGIGGTVQPKRDLTRFVKWPRYIRIQRQRAVLYKRLKIPPPINQFRTSQLNKQAVTQIFKLLHSYRPESKQAKKERLRTLAQAKAAGKKVPVAAKPPVLRFGTNNVTTLVEKRKAQLVVIAADCDPVEVVLHLPTLCRKMGIPYCIIKGGRPRLGHLVHRKTCSVVAITNVRPEDQQKLAKVIEVVRAAFNDRAEEIRRQWGGGQLGPKSKARKSRLDKAKAKELSQKVAASVAH
ncbi:60S ribosomal protein L7a, partial [Fragariocoptes setiger]